MGWQGMKEILRYPELYRLRILARPSKTNREKLRPIYNKVEIIWGDLTRYEDVLRGVSGADVVLHVGGMVSPRADYRPEETRRVNISAATHIRDAVLAQPVEHQPKVVYIGSVAQMGDRREPLHWGRAGDPICVSPYDHYGITKALAERIITDSPIRRWVSLRQSGILHPAILTNFDPIMFHVPLRGVLEWATIEDSGRVLERVCRPDVPEEFWRQYYNISSGAEYRLSNYEFECLLLQALGCPRPQQIFETKWFATRNFHGMWYLDGDKLEDMLHFRSNTPVNAYFRLLAKSSSLPLFLRIAFRSHIARLFPHVIKLVMRRLAYSPEHGTQWWIQHNEERRIRAFFGSREEYEAIPDWKHFNLSHNCELPVVLSHGFDEEKSFSSLTLSDLQQAAAFRGGVCFSAEEKEIDAEALRKDTGTTIPGKDVSLKDVEAALPSEDAAFPSKDASLPNVEATLLWRCAEGHTFRASARLVLLGGHWCPLCFPYPYLNAPDARPWRWGTIAKKNPFLAQLWSPLHSSDEDVYGPEIFEGWEKGN